MPMREIAILVRPRWRVRSAKKPIETVTMAAAAYGGTLRSCALIEVYPGFVSIAEYQTIMRVDKP